MACTAYETVIQILRIRHIGPVATGTAPNIQLPFEPTPSPKKAIKSRRQPHIGSQGSKHN